MYVLGLVVAVLALLIGIVALAIHIFGRRFRARLLKHPEFTPGETPASWNDSFVFAHSTDPTLSKFRDKYQLNRIAGDGTDLERAVRLMQWVHALTRRTPKPTRPREITGLHLTELAKEQGKRFNCWMYSTVLNDALLSVGLASRPVHLWPIQTKPSESHVVVSVYSRELGKWIHLDPDLCAFVTDEHGVPLGTLEIRERMISRQPLRVSDSVHIGYTAFLPKYFHKKLYLWYLSKNIFRMDSPAMSVPGYETEISGNTYIHLVPDGYRNEWLEEPRTFGKGNTIFYIRDPKVFWQTPGMTTESA